MRYFHLKHHDRNNDCDHAVAECLQPAFIHPASSPPLFFSGRTRELYDSAASSRVCLHNELCLWWHSILRGEKTCQGLSDFPQGVCLRSTIMHRRGWTPILNSTKIQSISSSSNRSGRPDYYGLDPVHQEPYRPLDR